MEWTPLHEFDLGWLARYAPPQTVHFYVVIVFNGELRSGMAMLAYSPEKGGERTRVCFGRSGYDNDVQKPLYTG